MTWGGQRLSWDGSSIVPHGVSLASTLSYIFCPLIADAIGHAEWYPAEVCPRPQQMGVEHVEYPESDAHHPGLGRFVLSGGGLTWGEAVTAVQRRLAALRITAQVAVGMYRGLS